MSLSLLEKIFSLTNVFPDKKRLMLFGIPFVWTQKKKFQNKPIQKNKVVFWSSTNSFTCNPKYIALKLMECSSACEIVWISTKVIPQIPELNGRIRFVIGGDASMRELATAKIIVANERTFDWFHKHLEKRSGQYLINTWHGALGIKKTGLERGNLTEGEVIRIEVDSRNVDLITSNSLYTTNQYKQIFLGHGRIVEVGLPRNDIFFRSRGNKVHSFLNLHAEVRFVLYAPTWRENGATDWYDIDASRVVDALKNRFGGEWVFLSRMHHLHQTTILAQGIDVSLYPDIQEIMAESEVVITDYSSCIYDFVMTKRPGFIYATDMETYDTTRGLMYPLSDTPFSIAKNMEELISNILNFDENIYQKDVEAFLDGKVCREDGKASERIARVIIDIMNGVNPDKLQIENASRFS